MKLKRFFVATLLAMVLTTTFTLSAQNYNTGFGVRLGYDSGLTYKNFFTNSSAFEGILSISPNYFQLAGLYEYQRPLEGVDNLDWYLGLGAHIGGIHHHKDEYDNAFLIGADIIGGLEYTFPEAPFALSLDWKPSFNFTNDYNDYWFSGFALTLRYTLR